MFFCEATLQSNDWNFSFINSEIEGVCDQKLHVRPTDCRTYEYVYVLVHVRTWIASVRRPLQLSPRSLSEPAPEHPSSSC